MSNETKRRWYLKHRDRQLRRYRTRRLLKEYGITDAQYETMRQLQSDRCAICQKGFVKTPHIDHDHKTGRVRGLLCCACNVFLGRLEAQPWFVGAAEKYLKAAP